MRLYFCKKKNPSEKIKEATLNLLAKNGYDAISMRIIAKEANVALGQLTYYYRTKEKLILSVVTEALDVFFYELKENVENFEDKIEGIEIYFDKLMVEDNSTIKVLVNLVSQSVWNEKLKVIISKFWMNVINYIKDIYLENNNDIVEEEAYIKARILIGTLFEATMENILSVKYDVPLYRHLEDRGNK